MKHIITSIAIFLAIGGISQTTATTNDGKKVSLKNDGTWSYITEDTKSSCEIFLTRNANEVVGFERIGEISESAMKAFGKQSKLRTEAEDKLLEKAKEQGACVVYIHKDVFSPSPLNNVNLAGTMYKEKSK